MTARLSAWAPLAAGTTFGGLLVGMAEGWYRDVSLIYSALLYGALWGFVGIIGAYALALLYTPRRSSRKVGAFTLAFALTIATSVGVLGRFILLRDFMGEASDMRWIATVGAATAAVLSGSAIVALGRYLAARLNPRAQKPWLWPLTIIVLFSLMAVRGGDNVSETLPNPTQLKGRGVIMIVVDTLRADALGVYGAHPSPTPNIDAFAKQASLFQDVSAQASWTRPAVASLMSSRHVSAHNTMAKTSVLPPSLPTLATELQTQGVKTAAVVTNYNLEESFGFARGFDHFEYLPPARYLGAPARANRLAAYNVYRLLREKLFRKARQARHFYRSAAAVNAAGLSILDQIGNEDFFLWLHYMEPHDPYFAADGSSFARVSDPHPTMSWADPMHAAYLNDVTLFDRRFGDLLQALAQRGLQDRVSIILTSDHGEEFGEHHGFYHGVTLYEEQLQIPLIVSTATQPPSIQTNVARQIDVAPTALGLLQKTAPPSWEGRDLFGTLSHPDFVMAEEDHEGNVLRSIRRIDGQKKLILANPDNPRGLASTELYDLGNDAAEEHPLTDASLVENLKLALDKAQTQARQGGAPKQTRNLDADAESALRSLGYVE
ncbi:MAG: sulfatase [Myxococcota bacterium]